METVLITGASRGIGLELTKQFLAQDYYVIATYRGETPSDNLDSLGNQDNLAICYLDVTYENSYYYNKPLD